MPTPAAASPGLWWTWRLAALGALYALPVVVIGWWQPVAAPAIAVALMPAAELGLPPSRRRRVVILVLGLVAAASLFAGALLTQVPAVAVLGLLGATVGAAALASRGRGGQIVLTLCVPLVGVGLSNRDLSTAAALLALMAAAALYAYLVALAWPEQRRPSTRGGPPQNPPLPPAVMLRYGVLVGTAAAAAAAVGYVLDLDHVGWAPAACLLVARPQPDLLRLRGVGRILAVLTGALAGTVVARAGLRDPAVALLVGIVLVSAVATAGSRWYITPAFTTFFVFLLLLHADTGQAAGRFLERLGETVIGVTLAVIAAWLVPTVLDRRQSARATPRPR